MDHARRWEPRLQRRRELLDVADDHDAEAGRVREPHRSRLRLGAADRVDAIGVARNIGQIDAVERVLRQEIGEAIAGRCFAIELADQLRLASRQLPGRRRQLGEPL